MIYNIDFTELRTESDIKIAKGKLRYSIHLMEDELSKSIGNLKNNFFKSLKKTVRRIGVNFAVVTAVRLLQSMKIKK